MHWRLVLFGPYRSNHFAGESSARDWTLLPSGSFSRAAILLVSLLSPLLRTPSVCFGAPGSFTYRKSSRAEQLKCGPELLGEARKAGILHENQASLLKCDKNAG